MYIDFNIYFFSQKNKKITAMNLDKQFEHIYNVENLIDFFASQQEVIFYLDTKTGKVSQTRSTQSFAFKPLTKSYVLSKIKLNDSSDFKNILKSNNKDKPILYNFIKSEVISFLAQNKLLPPSLHPILSFNEKTDESKIKVEIDL